MKKLFIETRKKFKSSEINFSVLETLPGKSISLAATIQYLGLLPTVKKYLESKGKIVIVKKGAFYKGQVLGCNPLALDRTADNLIIITDGKFHAMNNALKLKKEIFVFNTQTLEKITKKEIEQELRKIKAKQTKFLHSSKVGIIVSTKPGQNYRKSLDLRKKLEAINKEGFIFEIDTVNTGELENFPDIQIWVNTACFGLAADSSRIINLCDILEFL